MSNVGQGGETKENVSAKLAVKIQSAWGQSKSTAAEAKNESTQNRMDSLGQIAQSVSVCEKGIILQSHKREREGGFIHQATDILKRSLRSATKS